MPITATLDEYKHAEQALLRLALPEFSNHRTFRVSNSAFMDGVSGADAIWLWELKESDFPSPEDFIAAKEAPVVWLTELFIDPSNDSDKVFKTAASTLSGVLGHVGEDPQVQTIACQAFERFFGTLTLAFNDHLECGHETLQGFLESENQIRKERFPHYPPLFNDTPQQQADLAECSKNGIWTVIDQCETITLAAASTPLEALAQAWAIAPELEPLRRLQALEETLPAPHKGRLGPRF